MITLRVLCSSAALLLVGTANSSAAIITYNFQGVVTGMLEFTPNSTGPFLPGPIVFQGTTISVGDTIDGFFSYDTSIGGLPARNTDRLTGFVATINGLTSVSTGDVGVRFRNNQFGQDDFNFRSGFRDVRNVELVDKQQVALSGNDLFQTLDLADFLDPGDRRSMQVILGTAFNINGQFTSLSGPIIASTPPELPSPGPNVVYVPSDGDLAGGGPGVVPEPTAFAAWSMIALSCAGFVVRRGSRFKRLRPDRSRATAGIF